MLVNDMITYGMDVGSRYEWKKMVKRIIMMANGKKIKCIKKGICNMQMAMNITGIGSMGRKLDMANIYGKIMGCVVRDSGLMTK